MNFFSDMINTTGVYPATSLICFISGLLPLVNTEAYLLFLSSLTSKPHFFAIPMLSAGGQMLAKTVWYFVGRGFLKLPLSEKKQAQLRNVQLKFEKWEHGPVSSLVFVSAFVGLPPFLALSVAAGILRINVVGFVLAGFLGRALRFGLLYCFPQFIKGYLL